ncbi:helix-turn-helix transcriptional regulator [Nocardioides sp. NPDC101246]|uniref:helix-turn-helix transcriptional regulator n=1 Tax=Nocardioides sp. NPDC101246 TaxID=3364336 RepID=UPI00381F1E52
MESSEFGRMLRRRRDRVEPAAVGLPAGGRRRAAGLRREEVANLAGISVDYLTRLEQGRATSPSAQVVEALARALRLPDADRDLLFRLAGHVAPGREAISSRVSPSVQRLLDRLAHTPVVVYDAAWTLVVANEAYDALMGATTTWQGRERNAVWRNFVGPGSRALATAAETEALRAGLVADLRLTAARYPADHGLRRLVDDLRAASPRFADLWESADPSPRHEPARHKVIDHPTVGPIALDCDTLTVAVEDLRIMVYTAEPGTEDAERLALATVVGNQALEER